MKNQRGEVMDSNDIKAIESLMRLFARALENLYDNESDIVRNDVNERCMAAHVFSYMKNKMRCYKHLRQYKIDYEYNREGELSVPKELLCRYERDEKPQPHKIIPDLVVHVRGDVLGKKNLCIIEFKKFGINPSEDIVKLEGMTRQGNDGKFKYKIGLHVVFGVSLAETEIEVFIDGHSMKKTSIGDDVAELIKVVAAGVRQLDLDFLTKWCASTG